MTKIFIEITQSPPLAWYYNKIGEIFETTKEEISFYGSKQGTYAVIAEGGIYCADYVVINPFPTIKSEYFD